MFDFPSFWNYLWLVKNIAIFVVIFAVLHYWFAEEMYHIEAKLLLKITLFVFIVPFLWLLELYYFPRWAADRERWKLFFFYSPQYNKPDDLLVLFISILYFSIYVWIRRCFRSMNQMIKFRLHKNDT